MRLFNYLNEEMSVDDLNEEMSVDDLAALIEKDCKPFLSKIKWPFFRGTDTPGDAILPLTLYKKITRLDRTPMATSDKAFVQINKWLVANHHVPRNKAVIATSDTDSIKHWEFGPIYRIFPIGDFNYTWMKGGDFNVVDSYISKYSKFDFGNFLRTGNGISDSYYIKAVEKQYGKSVDEILNDFFTTNKGIKTAYDKEYEIWFDCKEYYLLDIESPLMRPIIKKLDLEPKLNWRVE